MPVHPYAGPGMPVPFPDAGVRDSIAEMPVHPDPGARMPVPHSSLRGAANAEMPVHPDSGAGMPVPSSHPHAGLRDDVPSCRSGVPAAGAGIRSAAVARVPDGVLRHAHLHSPGPPLASSLMVAFLSDLVVLR